MKLPRLKLVTFDVTDTLLQFRSSLGKQYSEIGLKHGVFCNEDALTSNFKANWYHLRKEHPNFGKNSIGWYDWWNEMVFRTFKAADLSIDDKKLKLISSDLIELYMSSQCWSQCYGTLGILSYLRNTGVKLGVISNFDERLSNLLENTHIRHYFNFIVTSYAVGFEKPDVQIFQEAFKKSQIENLKPYECLHIGDTAGVDYIGAKNANWNGALVNKDSVEQITEKYSTINPRDIYGNLYELHKYLLESNCRISDESLKT